MIETLKSKPLVPVVKINNAADVLPLCEAILEGGLNSIEITYRTQAAPEAIGLAAKSFPELAVGAGTVILPEQLESAVDNGASFVVSPGLNPAQIELAKAKNVLMIPGTITPTEVEQAMALGLDLLKFFPATAAGGTAMLKSFNAVYPVKFMPTGGIGLNNINDFLALPNIVACGGSWITPADLIDNGEWKKITALIKEAMSVIQGK